MAIVLNPTTSNPSPVSSVTSSDGYLTATLDDTHGGVLLRANFSGDATKPVQVQFLRNGLTVRSGDPAEAPGGIAYAYDQEAPLADSSAWTCTPIYADGSEGTTTTSAAISLSQLAGGYDFWVKSTSYPNLSTLARGLRTDLVTVGRTGRLRLSNVPGSSYPVAAWSPRGFADVTVTFSTQTLDERDSLTDCLDSGVLLVQSNPGYGLGDFYALAGDASQTPRIHHGDPRWVMTVTFVIVKRPPTIDAPFVFPGHSYGEQLAAAGTYGARLATWPTYADAMSV